MFGRRQGEILFRPVVGVELVLAGDPPKWNPDRQARFMVGVYYGHGTDWVRDAFLNADCDSGAAFKRMYMGEWAAEPEHIFIEGLDYVQSPELASGVGETYGGIDRAPLSANGWGYPFSARQAEMINDPKPQKLYGGSRRRPVDFLYGSAGGGKTARLDDLYKNSFVANPPMPKILPSYLPEELKADSNQSEK